MRVGVVGARRVRQGTGGYLARFLARDGADVVAVAGSRMSTAREAAADLARDGIVVEPWDDAERMIQDAGLDALVIASPHATHEPLLERALDAGLHVLCEKPLCWGGADPAGSAERLARAYAARGRHLVVQAQWPHVLPAYRALHPDALRAPPRRFDMRLTPLTMGGDMLADTLPHPLSLLAAVLPDAGAHLEDVAVSLSPDRRAMDVSFGYRAGGRVVATRVAVRHSAEGPREASLGFDGAIARRIVHVQGGYRMELEAADGRRVPLPDPAAALVGTFVHRVRSGAPASIDPAAVPGMRHLAALSAALHAEAR
jgi:predicted dehydrogenase